MQSCDLWTPGERPLRWAEQEGHCKVLLEAGKTILRRAIRRRAQLSSLSVFRSLRHSLYFAQGRAGCFTTGRSHGTKLGKRNRDTAAYSAQQARSLKATRVLSLSEPKSIELEAVLEQAGAINEGNPNLVLAYVTMPAEVHAAMEQSVADRGLPLWVI